MMTERLSQKESNGKRPLVSIVVPVYNAENSLASCLNSIFAQTYSEYEVIMIDDGSTDGSCRICDLYAKKYPNKLRYVKQKNSGPATARNNGINLSRGKYIAFVDADDQIAKDMIVKMTNVAEKSRAEMVICAYWLVTKDKRKTIIYSLPEGLYSDGDSKKIALSMLDEKTGDIPPYSWVRLTAKDVFEKSGLRFHNGLIRSEDFHFWTKIHFWVNRVYLLSQTPLYNYIENKQSITHRHIDGYWNDVLFMFQDLRNALPKDEEVINKLNLMLVKRSLIALNNSCYSRSFFGAHKEIVSILKNKILNKVILKLSESKTQRFRSYRYMMQNNLKILIYFKYTFRRFGYLLKIRS